MLAKPGTSQHISVWNQSGPLDREPVLKGDTSQEIKLPMRRFPDEGQLARLACRCSVLSDLRAAIDVRYAAQRRRSGGRVGHAVASTGGCEGIQKVLADEASDEARSADQAKPEGQRRRAGFWHSQDKLMGF